MLALRPITYKAACQYVDLHHRHHKKPQGHKYSIAATWFGKVVGVVMTGRPVSRYEDDGWQAEITRLCTDGTKDSCSLLYGAAARAAKAMGYRWIITYTLASEPGTSLRAAGFRIRRRTPGRGWGCKSRPRTDKHKLGEKVCWERQLCDDDLGVFA